MGKKLSQEIISQIPILYDKYKNKSKVAKELGITPNSVTKYLTISAAAPLEEKKKTRTKVTPELIEKINKEYANYKNMSKVAQILGISPSTVKNYLSEENIKLSKQINDDRDALWFYIYRLFGQAAEDKPVSDWNITQMMKFKNQGMPYRGQLLALKYFYEVKKNSIDKSNGSIGIIPWIWEESRTYYSKIEQKQKEIGEAIQQQLERDRLEIKYNPSDYIGKKRKKKEINLDTI